MRKTLFCMLLAVMILGSLPAYAAAERPELLCIADAVDEDGGCDVALELVNAEGIAMMQFSLRYDPEKLAFLGSELGTVFTGGLAPTLNTLQSGEIVLSWDSLSPLQSDGTILLLHMRLLGAESATLYFGGDDDLIFARDDFEPLDVRCAGCTIDRPTVTATPVATPSTHPPVSEPPAQVTDPPVNITIPAAQVTATPAPVAPIHTPVPVTESPTVTAVPGAQTEATPAPVVESPASTKAVMPTPAVFLSPDETQSLTMQDEQITIAPGETQKIEVVEDETSLFWSSSDERVATVDENGIVTAHAEGSVQITVSNEDGTAYVSSTVTVSSQGNSTKNEVQPSAAQITVEYDETENVDTATAKEETAQKKAKETTLTTDQTEAAQITAVTGQEEQKTPNSSAAFVAVVFACIIIVLFFLMRKKRLQIKSKTTEENK